MTVAGGCRCRAIRHQIAGDALTHALCHCRDRRRHPGAPMVGWTMYREEQVTVTTGAPKTYASSTKGRRRRSGRLRVASAVRWLDKRKES